MADRDDNYQTFLASRTAFIVAAADSLAQQRREQLFELFPALAPILPEFAEEIDRASPFVEAVAARLGVWKSAVRRLRGVTANIVDHCGADIAWLIRTIDRTPADYVPTVDGDWYEFIDAQRVIDELAGLRGRPAADLCAESNGKWATIAQAAWRALDSGLLPAIAEDRLSAQVLDFYRSVFCPEVFIELRRLNVDITATVVEQVAVCDAQPTKLGSEK